MGAKEYLSRIGAMKAEISRIEQNIRQLEAALQGAKAIRYDTVRVQSAPENAMERNIAELEELKAKWISKKTALIREIAETEEKIGKLEPKYAELLYRRYVEGLPLWKIAAKMGYSDEYTRKMHGRALTEFELKNRLKKGTSGNKDIE